MRFPITDYNKIVSYSVPGTNNDPAKAEELWDFVLLDRFTEMYSKEEKKDGICHIQIHAAIVSEKYAWCIIDFSRLVHFHVISRDMIWREEDLLPTNSICLAPHFPYSNAQNHIP